VPPPTFLAEHMADGAMTHTSSLRHRSRATLTAGLDRNPVELAAEFRAAAAAKWYEVGRVSQEVAAQIAGVSRSELLTVLSPFKVSPMQESAEEALAGARVHCPASHWRERNGLSRSGPKIF
jgi:hypothetical protein